MADDNATPESEPVSGQDDTPQPSEPKADVPPEMKKALREANKEAEKLRLKLKEYEDRDKTEAEKAAEALQELALERDGAVSELARMRAALKYGLSTDDLDLLGSGPAEDIEARAKRLADRLAESGSPRKPQPDPSQGRRTPSGTSTADQFAAALGGSL